MSKSNRLRKQGFSLLVALLFLFRCAPFAALAEGANAEVSAPVDAASASSNIAQQIGKADYAEGVVLAAVYSRYENVTDWLAGHAVAVEVLSRVSAEHYFSQNAQTPESAAPTSDEVLILQLTSSTLTTEEMLLALQQDTRVLSAEPDYLAPATAETAVPDATPVEPPVTADTASASVAAPDGSAFADLTALQWGMQNNGAASYTGNEMLGFDLNPPAWDAHHTDGSVKNACGVVAIIDDGVDVTHPDLKNVLMTDMDRYNPAGGPYGINLTGIGDVKDVTDYNGHGTHVAGIIASEWNGFGTSGVANGVKLAIVKFYTPEGRQSVSREIRAYEYLATAMDNGLNLVAINNSWGGFSFSQMLSVIVTELGERGAISVFSSGNESLDADTAARPAGALTHNPYALTVDASTVSGQLSYNYGQGTTDLLAPGIDVLSCYPTQNTAYLSVADAAPVYKDSFAQTGAKSVRLYSTFDAASATPGTPIPRRLVSDRYYDTDRSALYLESNQLGRTESASPTGGTEYELYLELPLESRAFTFLGLALYHSLSSSYLNYGLSAAVQSPGQTGITWQDCTGESSLSQSAGPSTWANCFADLTSLSGNSLYYTGEGCALFKLSFSTREENLHLYLDCLAAGSTVTPYAYGSGTSMAAPMVTGAAAVVAKTQGLENGQPTDAAQRAALACQRVLSLKAYVNQYGGKYLDQCTSGGQLDLSVSDSAVLPVITDARVEGDNILLTGQNFRQNAGSVTVDGTEAEILSWCDTSITVRRPKTVTGGLKTLRVHTVAGYGSARYILIFAGHSPSLMEKNIALPTGFSLTSMNNIMAACGSSLYVFPQSLYQAFYDWDEQQNAETTNHGSFRAVWRYEPSTDQWCECAPLPEQADWVSATEWKGKLLAYATKLDWYGQSSSQLFAYDPADNSWQRLQTDALPCAATMLNVAGTLLLVGGTETTPIFLGGRPAILPLLAQNNINAFDPETGSVTCLGSLSSPAALPLLAAEGTTVYALLGKRVYASGFNTYDSSWQKLTKSEPGYLAEDVKYAFPFAERVQTSNNWCAAATSPVGIVVTGAYPTEDATQPDTFILQDGALHPYGKLASYAPLIFPSATVVNGWLYVMGSSSFEDNVLVLRATKLVDAPSPTVSPSPTGSPLPTVSPLPTAVPVATALPTAVPTAIPTGSMAAATTTAPSRVASVPSTGDAADLSRWYLLCILSGGAGLALWLHNQKHKKRSSYKEYL